MFKVLISGDLQMEDLVGLLVSSLFNAARFLVKTHIESILDVLDALISEEGCGCMQCGGIAEQRGLWGFKS